MATAQDFAELGERIRYVRLASNESQDQLGRAIGVDRTAISRIESGERKTSAVELLKLAAHLKVTLSDLIEQPSPDVVAARPHLDDDAAPEERAHSRAELELDRALRDARQLQGYGLIRVADLPFLHCGLDSEQQGQDLAREARRFLGNDEAPLGSMTDVAARFGLWCRTTSQDVQGLSLTPEPGFGVALVAEGLEPGRRRATVAHELGHHLSGDTYESAGHYSAPAESERFIEAFAAEFLLPAAAVRKLDGRASRESLIRTAAEYRVSWSLLTRSCDRVDLDVSRAEMSLKPVRAEFLTVLGATPEPDVEPPGLPRAWIAACARAGTENLVTDRRAYELSCGVVG